MAHSLGFSDAKQAIVIGAILASSGVLAVLSYQHFTSVADSVASSARDDVRSNARIQVGAIADSFSNKMKQISGNVAILASSQEIREGQNEGGIALLNTAQSQTQGITGAYVWQDKDGNVVWATVYTDEEVRRRGEGLNLSQRPYFVMPKETLKPYFGQSIESLDNVPRIHISYPVLRAATDQESQSTEFAGAVSTAVSLADIGRLLESELSSEQGGRLEIIDSAGSIIYSPSNDFVGLNVFGQEYQSAVFPSNIPEEEKAAWNNHLRNSLESNERGWQDFAISGITTTSAYEPIIINDQHFMTIYLALPHTFAANTVSLVEQQQNFSVFIVVIITAVSVGLSVLVLRWNKTLQNTIQKRTSELEKSNQNLENSNDQLKEKNLQLAQANKQLKERELLEKEFINIAAHELRTPIQPVLGIVELLASDLDGKEKIEVSRDDIGILSRSANRLERLSAQLLDAARIESSTLKLNIERVDLVQKIRNVIAETKKSPQFAAGVEILFQEPQYDIVVEADKARLFEVVSNLLSNAVKFTASGSITISAEKTQDGRVARVKVTDSGTGIHPDMKPKLFTRFASKSESGTGIGLYLSKSIIEAHGGTIWGDNNPDGNGATFGFEIPLDAGKIVVNSKQSIV